MRSLLRRVFARRRVRALLLLLALGVGVGGLAAGWLWDLLAGSLPRLDGELRVAGLGAPVRVERDGLGVPTLYASSRDDVAFATGFVHAQDRFFQMDLLRRHAAGELAALLGPVEQALKQDRAGRLHGFRELARRKVEALGEDDRALLAAYVRGVEAGRRSLRRPPFEYRLLGVQPESWREEDTVLVALSMFRVLHAYAVERESAAGLLEDLLPGALADFLSPQGSTWDAPLDGSPRPGPPIPGPEVIDLRKGPPGWPADRRPPPPDTVRPGSNNWAVAGKHTTHGGALVANDMHLWLGVPNIWYRAAFVWPGADGRDNKVVGVTLPGTPAMVVGSNTHVAWGFTNTEGDWTDLVLIEPDPLDPQRYLAPGGPRRFRRRAEVIRVRGAADVTVTVESTVWGPVIDKDHKGRRRALRWTAHDLDAHNFDLLKMETARTLEGALAVAHRAGMPPQNVVVADARGDIAWTVAGRLPRRVGFDGRTPASWARGRCGWDGWLTPREVPRVVRPKEGRLWTANNRVVGDPEVGKIGRSAYDLGARAGQIRDGLRARRKVNEADMLGIQLDDRALFLARWQRLLLEVLGGRPDRQALRQAVAEWGGRASVESVGFRVVRNFRREVHAHVLRELTAPCRQADPDFSIAYLDPNVEDSVWQLVTRRPVHMLPRRYDSWEALLLACVDAVCWRVREEGGGPLEEALGRYTWGEHNTVHVAHPFSDGLGPLGRWLRVDMPEEPLPGDSHAMPRVQAPRDGASQRMAVSPGREEEGYFHMPGGQSGHPLSPHYRDGHAAWARGERTPFLPGPARHTLVLVPR